MYGVTSIKTIQGPGFGDSSKMMVEMQAGDNAIRYLVPIVEKGWGFLCCIGCGVIKGKENAVCICDNPVFW